MEKKYRTRETNLVRIVVDRKREAISVGEDEEPLTLTAKLLTSVECVYMAPPPHRRAGVCCIFGDISVTDTDDPKASGVTLFSRSFDDPQALDLSDNESCYLCLTHDDSDRALSGDSDSYITLHLYENKKARELYVSDEEEKEESLAVVGGEDQRGSEEVEDPDIEELLRIEAFKFEGFEDKVTNFVFEGKHGFDFEVRNVKIYGARVKVEVTINKEIKLNDTDSVESIYGYITAWQQLENRVQHSGVRLYSASVLEPTMVCVGGPIILDRHTVVAPLAGGWLCIALELWTGGDGQERLVVDELVHFVILPIDNYHGAFLTNQKRKHTKEAANGLFSVSITFVE